MFNIFFSFLTVFSLVFAQSCDVATMRGALQDVHVRGRQGTATCDVTALVGTVPLARATAPLPLSRKCIDPLPLLRKITVASMLMINAR